MSGVKSNIRTNLRLAREERLVIFIAEGRPVSAVALLEGIEHDYAYQLLTQVAKRRGLDYQAKRVARPGLEEIPGLTAASRALRSRLGNNLYNLKLEQSEIARKLGITARNQQFAKDTPFRYDWSLSQIERLANEVGTPFESFLLQLLLTPTEITHLQQHRRRTA